MLNSHVNNQQSRRTRVQAGYSNIVLSSVIMYIHTQLANIQILG